VGAVTPSYDGNGNLTSDGTFIYAYDGRNRLTSAVGAGNTAAYVFDAQGRRKTKTVNGTTTVYVTDADNREVLEYDGTSGAILRWYAYGLGANNVLNQSNIAAGTRSTLVPDIQGSIIATLDSGTATLTKASYRPMARAATRRLRSATRHNASIPRPTDSITTAPAIIRRCLGVSCRLTRRAPRAALISMPMRKMIRLIWSISPERRPMRRAAVRGRAD
jgi:YD repeat-containing protein